MKISSINRVAVPLARGRGVSPTFQNYYVATCAQPLIYAYIRMSRRRQRSLRGRQLLIYSGPNSDYVFDDTANSNYKGIHRTLKTGKGNYIHDARGWRDGCGR